MQPNFQHNYEELDQLLEAQGESQRGSLQGQGLQHQHMAAESSDQAVNPFSLRGDRPNVPAQH